MITLPNNCRCSELSVFPKNWESKEADLNLTWYIKYRFYPAQGKPKQVVIKGFSDHFTLTERRKAVKEVIKDELYRLRFCGYNPAKNEFLPEIQTATSLLPQTTFIKALYRALGNVRCSDNTRTDIRSVVKYFSIAASKIGLDIIPVSEVRRKHIKLILDTCGTVKNVWNDNQYNHYRKYISLLFTELMELEAVETNPIINKQVKKKSCKAKRRETLTDEQCILVDTHLYNNYYTFWRFMKIFYFSGSREIELLAIKKEDVNLKEQTFTVTINKGNQGSRKVEKPIHKETLQLWIDLFIKAKAGQYLFADSLMPGTRPKPIRREHVTRRWKSHVKDKLGIQADLYSLKHHFLDKVTELKGIQAAQEAASHTTPVITMTYAVNEVKRRMDELRNIPVKFGR